MSFFFRSLIGAPPVTPAERAALSRLTFCVAIISLRVREYDTDVQRWDPLTGGAAALLGTVTDFTAALGGVFLDPFKEYKRVRQTHGTDGAAGKAAAASAGANAAAAVGAITKGTFVEVPLAITEGLRNTPRLYGGEVDPVEKVTDWKSGGKAAGKVGGGLFSPAFVSTLSSLYYGSWMLMIDLAHRASVWDSTRASRASSPNPSRARRKTVCAGSSRASVKALQSCSFGPVWVSYMHQPSKFPTGLSDIISSSGRNGRPRCIPGARHL